MFLQCLNTSLITVPLPKISSDLGINVSSSSWLLLAYSIGTCSMLIPFTKYAKNGRSRPFFIYGVILFLFTSFDCYLAKDFLTLMILRFIQGASISMAVATCPIFVVQKMPENIRGTAMGTIAAGTGLAMAIGPSIGGILTEFISWHMLFLINIPIGLGVLIVAIIFLPKDSLVVPGKDPAFYGCVALFATIMFGLMLIENIGNWGAVQIFIVGFIAFFSLLILVWNICYSKGREPVIHPGLLRSKLFKYIAISAAIGSMITEGSFYLLPYFMEISWGMGITECGIYFGLVSVTTFACARLTGKYCDNHSSKYPAITSFICTLIFSILFVILIPGSGFALLILSACMVGASFAMFETAQYLRMIRNTPSEFKEESAIMVDVVTYIGASLGLIFYSTVFDTVVPLAKNGMEYLSAAAMTHGFHAAGILGILLSIIGVTIAMKVPHDKQFDKE